MAELRDDNDEALRWGSDVDDPSYLESESDVLPPVTTGEGDPNGDGADTVSPGPTSTGSVLLVVYGVLAGAYALFTVGWIIGIQGNVFVASTLLVDIMFQFGEFLAIASPALWFGVTVLLTRGGRAIARVGWLVAGLVIVAPWPFILSGAAL